MNQYNLIKGTVYNIQRYSLHDGPGIRTIVFLKGCPLRCLWCSNPESQYSEPQMMGDELIGKEMTVSEVMDVVRRDKVFYQGSGGGITLSGGEALMQPAFSEGILMAAKNEGINTAIETAGFASWDALWKVIKNVDVTLFDIKTMDNEKHIEYTGVPNKIILENIEKLIQYQKRVIIRVPLIPSFNDSDENLMQLCEFCMKVGIKKVEVLPYHRLGEGKYNKLQLPYQLEGIVPKTKSEIIEKIKALKVDKELDISVI